MASWPEVRTNRQPSRLIITMIIIIIGLKGAVWDFLQSSRCAWTVSNTYIQVAKVQSCANHLQHGARIAQLVVHGLAVHGVAGSILLWGHFPVEGIFPLELTWVQTPFPQNSFGWEYKPRSSLCTHAFHRTDSKDPDVHVLNGWMPATKTHPARTIHKDGMWLP